MNDFLKHSRKGSEMNKQYAEKEKKKLTLL